MFRDCKELEMQKEAHRDLGFVLNLSTQRPGMYILGVNTTCDEMIRIPGFSEN